MIANGAVYNGLLVSERARERLASRLLNHLALQRGQTLIAVLWLVVAAASLYALARWAGAFLPMLVSGAPFPTLWREALFGVVLLAVVTGSAALRDVTLVSLSAGFSSAVRLQMLAALVRQPAAVARVRSEGETLMRVAGDIALLHQALVRTLAIWAPSVVTSTVLLLMIIADAPALAGVMALLIAPMLMAIGGASGRLQGSVRLAQDQLAELGGAVGEALSGVREAKVFRREDALEQRFAALSNSAVQHLVREERVAVTHPAIVSFVAVTGLLALVLLAAWWQRRGSIDGAGLTRFLVLLGLLVGPLQESIRSFSATVRLRALFERCADVLVAPVERDPPGARSLGEGRGAVTFSAVTVRFRETGFVLGPFDLDIAAGETIVLVGPSGSGKSTLLELVPRLGDADDGLLCVDGVPVGDITLASLRAQCALVPQEPYFFRGTIAENLTFAVARKDDAGLHAACRAAHVEEFVHRLPAGYDTMLARGAANLSVGQRQRLAMARAMLVAPRILLLDEPTAALDEESEQLIVDAVRAFSVGRTTIIASHSARVLPLAHRVVRLVHGRVVSVERGARSDPPRVIARLPVPDAE